MLIVNFVDHKRIYNNDFPMRYNIEWYKLSFGNNWRNCRIACNVKMPHNNNYLQVILTINKQEYDCTWAVSVSQPFQIGGGKTAIIQNITSSRWLRSVQNIAHNYLTEFYTVWNAKKATTTSYRHQLLAWTMQQTRVKKIETEKTE